MFKQSKVDIFLAYLDRILAGESDIGHVEDAEIAELLSLARSMITADFSIKCKTREKLRNQILTRIFKKGKSDFSMLSGYDGELDENALDQVVAGFERQDEEQMNMLKSIKPNGSFENKG